MALEARVPPNQSLYVQNLPEKLQKEDLRRQLYMLFSTYGPVIDITAMKTSKMRGQAHILFRDVQAATQAMRACQNFEFYGREMRIQYAKSKSLTLAKLTGNFDPLPQQNDARPQALPPPGFAGAARAFPPPGLPAARSQAPAGLPAPPPGLPAAPKAQALAPPATPANAPSPQGTKRQREDSGDEAPMDEDDDGEGEMDMSDSD